jgi:putative N-acetylmannosamine-6-phosphate epimerase
MPLGIPDAMSEEHEELHAELAKATKIGGKVGKAARHVAELLHPHFERENELALPVIGVTRELAQDETSPDFAKALQLADKFKDEYEKLLQEHAEIVKALDGLEKAANAAKKRAASEFVKKLKLHAKTEEDLTYPAVLMAGILLRQWQWTHAC